MRTNSINANNDFAKDLRGINRKVKLVLVSSVQIAGILQVFSFLVIPALIGRLYTKEPSKILLAGWAMGFLASFFGVFFSYRLDIPTAPLIVASLSIVFFVILAWKGRRVG